MIVCPETKQKQPQDHKTHFETISLPFAKIVSPVARCATTKKEFPFGEFQKGTAKNLS